MGWAPETVYLKGQSSAPSLSGAHTSWDCASSHFLPFLWSGGERSCSLGGQFKSRFCPLSTCVTAVLGLASFCEMGVQCGLTYLQWPPWGLREKCLTPSYCLSFGTISPGLGEVSSISQASVGLVHDVQMSYIGWGLVLLPQSRRETLSFLLDPCHPNLVPRKGLSEEGLWVTYEGRWVCLENFILTRSNHKPPARTKLALWWPLCYPCPSP